VRDSPPFGVDRPARPPLRSIAPTPAGPRRGPFPWVARIATLRRFPQPSTEHTMGKGDRRTTRGKIAISSYGNKRPHKPKKPAAAKTAVTKAAKPAAKAATKATAAKKAPAKKAAPKKEA
jgi:ribosomal small subunit protein bTHX